MMNYEEVYKKLWQTVLEHEQQLTENAQNFLSDFVQKIRSSGMEITPDSQKIIETYLANIKVMLESGVSKAIALGLGVNLANPMQSPIVLKAMKHAFAQRYPDGLNLSQRLWNFNKTTQKGIEDVLKSGIAHSKSVNQLVYQMQREIEAAKGAEKFKVITHYNSDDWAAELYSTAKGVIKNPQDRKLWQKTINDVREHLDKLSITGTRDAAEHLFKQVTEAVNTGNAELLDNSLKWWIYDKQLYQLKRITRTEMANATHQAVIASTEQDDTIIGYQWRLSSSHSGSSCVCAYYASVDMGYGKGVYTKASVPHNKPHPHCMCLLIPRVTPVKENGSHNYAQFLQTIPLEEHSKLLPKWAGNLNALGVPFDKLVKSDGMGLITQQDFKARLGEDKFQAVTAIANALSDDKWADLTLKPRNKMSVPVLDALNNHQHVPEVSTFLKKLTADNYKVNSAEWHYFKYKYFYNEPLKDVKEFNSRIDRILRAIAFQVITRHFFSRI